MDEPKKLRPRVYIPNKSVHDFSAAEEFGDLIFLSEGSVKKYSTNVIYRDFYHILQYSNPFDYLLVTGLTSLNIVATHILTKLHGRLNLLLFKPGKGGKKEYLERILT